MKAFILAGGGGTRLFPLSRDKYPKQFLKFFDKESLLQKTVKRVLKIVRNFDDIVFLTNKDYVFLLKEQIFEKFNERPKHIILEPLKRNTAPAISLGVKYLVERGIEADEPIFVFPADHLIRPEEDFVRYIEEAQSLTKAKSIVTFGIIPSKPETGYGYIEADKNKVISLNNFQAFKVKKFHEKPSLETAQRYLEEGNFYWNSGIFGFTAETF